MTGDDLNAWRRSKGWTQQSLGDALGCSHTAVNRWENGQDIPGPVQKLLRLLMFGENPFTAGSPLDTPLDQSAFTVKEWEHLDRLRLKRGFRSVREYLVHTVREHLKAESSAPAKRSKK